MRPVAAPAVNDAVQPALEDGDSDDVIIDSDDVDVPENPAQLLDVPAAEAPGQSDDDLYDGPLPPAPPQPGANAGRAAAASADEDENDAIIGDDDVWPTSVGGFDLRFEDFKGTVKRPRGYQRLIITCKCHTNCEKHRNVGEKQTRLGARAPIGFLHVWAQAGHNFTTASDHRDFVPTDDAVKRWLDTEAPAALGASSG